ncbi:uncharacterized protein L969DRAFT_62637 [Mixia osmundae IAM 14324]|uniref:FHA domain-containing protein n=1 Tax=Mixia osmundae (strain CBS 9802 / IAM 14324 / JCM 22182 / KY 12970) TaxID=764103 RepID=G7E474_MIXOS|nr:uncharacterized protein L969DRAFT_62637 [Mixia osmundae IAM 14324]KEI39730.1 hypothetical protein L969DRAFT_62637 [Mixia osmundae IAM 14324]GAA97634.1 hypothetical protein E5Q_04312 [Mixia osmundae IAM 14324]
MATNEIHSSSSGPPLPGATAPMTPIAPRSWTTLVLTRMMANMPAKWDKRISLVQGEPCQVGRSSSTDPTRKSRFQNGYFDCPTMSRDHGRFELDQDGQVWYYDTSSNGTAVSSSTHRLLEVPKRGRIAVDQHSLIRFAVKSKNQVSVVATLEPPSVDGLTSLTIAQHDDRVFSLDADISASVPVKSADEHSAVDLHENEDEVDDSSSERLASSVETTPATSPAIAKLAVYKATAPGSEPSESSEPDYFPGHGPMQYDQDEELGSAGVDIVRDGHINQVLERVATHMSARAASFGAPPSASEHDDLDDRSDEEDANLDETSSVGDRSESDEQISLDALDNSDDFGSDLESDHGSEAIFSQSKLDNLFDPRYESEPDSPRSDSSSANEREHDNLVTESEMFHAGHTDAKPADIEKPSLQVKPVEQIQGVALMHEPANKVTAKTLYNYAVKLQEIVESTFDGLPLVSFSELQQCGWEADDVLDHCHDALDRMHTLAEFHMFRGALRTYMPSILLVYPHAPAIQIRYRRQLRKTYVQLKAQLQQILFCLVTVDSGSSSHWQYLEWISFCSTEVQLLGCSDSQCMAQRIGHKFRGQTRAGCEDGVGALPDDGDECESDDDESVTEDAEADGMRTQDVLVDWALSVGEIFDDAFDGLPHNSIDELLNYGWDLPAVAQHCQSLSDKFDNSCYIWLSHPHYGRRGYPPQLPEEGLAAALQPANSALRQLLCRTYYGLSAEFETLSMIAMRCERPVPPIGESTMSIFLAWHHLFADEAQNLGITTEQRQAQIKRMTGYAGPDEQLELGKPAACQVTAIEHCKPAEKACQSADQVTAAEPLGEGPAGQADGLVTPMTPSEVSQEHVREACPSPVPPKSLAVYLRVIREATALREKVNQTQECGLNDYPAGNLFDEDDPHKTWSDIASASASESLAGKTASGESLIVEELTKHPERLGNQPYAQMPALTVQEASSIREPVEHTDRDYHDTPIALPAGNKRKRDAEPLDLLEGEATSRETDDTPHRKRAETASLKARIALAVSGLAAASIATFAGLATLGAYAAD